MEQLASKRNLWFAISLIVMVPGVISLAIFGLNLGIDFTGGSAWEIQFDRQVNTEAIQQTFAANGRPEAQVQQIGDEQDHTFLIRLRELPEVPGRR